MHGSSDSPCRLSKVIWALVVSVIAVHAKNGYCQNDGNVLNTKKSIFHVTCI